MTMSDDQAQADRLRRPPVERFAGKEHVFDLAAEGARLRGEAHAAKDGHRQIALFRQDPVSLILFELDAGGLLSDHVAEGIVVIHVLSGQAEIRTPEADHLVPEGSLLVLRPGVRHDLSAPVASRVLLSVHLTGGS